MSNYLNKYLQNY